MGRVCFTKCLANPGAAGKGLPCGIIGGIFGCFLTDGRTGLNRALFNGGGETPITRLRVGSGNITICDWCEQIDASSSVTLVASESPSCFFSTSGFIATVCFCRFASTFTLLRGSIRKESKAAMAVDSIGLRRGLFDFPCNASQSGSIRAGFVSESRRPIVLDCYDVTTVEILMVRDCEQPQRGKQRKHWVVRPSRSHDRKLWPVERRKFRDLWRR